MDIHLLLSDSFFICQPLWQHQLSKSRSCRLCYLLWLWGTCLASASAFKSGKRRKGMQQKTMKGVYGGLLVIWESYCVRRKQPPVIIANGWYQLEPHHKMFKMTSEELRFKEFSNLS